MQAGAANEFTFQYQSSFQSPSQTVKRKKIFKVNFLFINFPRKIIIYIQIHTAYINMLRFMNKYRVRNMRMVD